MSSIKFFTAYDTPVSPGVDCSVEPSMTKQSFAAECDVNNIMAQFVKTGLLDFVNQNEPRYGEVPSVDFQLAMEIVAQGQSMFEQLPGDLRQYFGNDPAEFLAFVEDPTKIEESIALGVRTRPVIVSTGEVAPVVPSVGVGGVAAPVVASKDLPASP